MVPTVPNRVIFDDELRGDRGTEAQGERRRPIQLFIAEGANRFSRLPAILSQQFERLGLRDLGMLAGVGPALQFRGTDLPRHVRHGLPAGEMARAEGRPRWGRRGATWIHNLTDRPPVGLGRWGSPLGVRQPMGEGGEARRTFLDAGRASNSANDN